MERSLPMNVILFVLSLLCLRGLAVDSGVCPRYCKCYMWNGLRRADCINQRLVNIDTGVSRAAEAYDLSNNSIVSLENRGFQDLGLVDLWYLCFQFNKISSVGLHAFIGMNKLQIIDLSENRLHYLSPGTFLDTPLLQVLYLNKNKLGNIAGPFLDSSSLKVLDISSCQLGDLQADLFSHLPSLTDLNLSDNQLIHVDVNTLSTLAHLKSVDLSKNPWPCDGDTRDLQKWLHMRGIPDLTQCRKEEKSGKIISLVTNEPENDAMEEDISNLWFENKERDRDDEKESKNVTASNRSSLHTVCDIIEKIPSCWALIIGLEVGSLVTMFGMYIWLGRPKVFKNRVHRYRRPRSFRLTSLNNEVSWTELETPICPDTPPPPYHFNINSMD